MNLCQRFNQTVGGIDMMRQTGFTLGVAASIIVVSLAGCQTTPTQDGMVVGGILGSGLGAIVGHQSGKQGEGALIGAGLGMLTGALIGDQVDEQRNRAPRPEPVVLQEVNPAPEGGRWETRLMKTPSGEYMEERVWVRTR